MFSQVSTRTLSYTVPLLALGAALILSPRAASAGEWSVGANILAARSPYVGEDGMLAIMPVVAYKGDRLHANLGNPGIGYFNGITDFAGLGYSVVKGHSYSIDLVGRVRLIGLDPDDADELLGLEERKPGFDLGISTNWDSGIGEFNAELLTDVSNRSDGWEAVLSYAYPYKRGAWTLRPEFGLSWQSANLADYYFGVDSAEVITGRAAYEGDATLTPFAAVQMEYAFSDQTHMVGGVGISRLGEGIADSPIVDQHTLGGGYVGLVYRF